MDHCGKSKHKDKVFDSVIVSNASAHLLDGASGRALVRHHLVLFLIIYITTLTHSNTLDIQNLVVDNYAAYGPPASLLLIYFLSKLFAFCTFSVQ